MTELLLFAKNIKGITFNLRLWARSSSSSPSFVTAESGEERSILESAVLEFSSVLRVVAVMGEGEERELEPGDLSPGNRLWPGEKRGGSGRDTEESEESEESEETGGWKAEGKDLRMGVSPVIANMGLGSIIIITIIITIIINIIITIIITTIITIIINIIITIIITTIITIITIIIITTIIISPERPGG